WVLHEKTGSGLPRTSQLSHTDIWSRSISPIFTFLDSNGSCKRSSQLLLAIAVLHFVSGFLFL
ncbi:hypothetical protein, partial [Echinicola sediminis]